MSPVTDELYQRVAPGALADWQELTSSFEAVAGYRWFTVDLLDDGAESERLNGLRVTPEFFEVFGVALVGRGFRGEDRGTRTLVLGNEVWRLRFDGVAALIGTRLDVNVRNFDRVGPTPHTVLGIATEPVRFPPLTADFQLGLPTVVDTIDVWAPQFVTPMDFRENRVFDVVGRLRPDVTIAQAQAEMDAVAERQATQYPEAHRGWGVRVVPLREHLVGDSRTGVLLLVLGTGMVLLIACTNVATLLLACGAARGREVAVRTALGATRWRIGQQFLMEAVILATWAGALDSTVMVFALICALVTACLTGIVPALRSTGAAGERLMDREGRGLTPDRHRVRLVGVLVSAEVALALMLCLGAGLLLRSALSAWQVDPARHSLKNSRKCGLAPRNLATFCASPRPVGTDQLKYFAQFLARFRTAENRGFPSRSIRFQPAAC